MAGSLRTLGEKGNVPANYPSTMHVYQGTPSTTPASRLQIPRLIRFMRRHDGSSLPRGRDKGAGPGLVPAKTRFACVFSHTENSPAPAKPTLCQPSTPSRQIDFHTQVGDVTCEARKGITPSQRCGSSRTGLPKTPDYYTPGWLAAWPKRLRSPDEILPCSYHSSSGVGVSPRVRLSFPFGGAMSV